MATRYGVIQLKRGTQEAWQRNNPILLTGEAGFEIDTNRLKIGDGKTTWNDLTYQDSNSIFNAKTHYDFPSIGKEHIIYKASEEKLLYQWNPKELIYEALNIESGTPIDINLIHGGNANGIA